MFQHISGALNKINKKSAHAADQKMTLCTHRVAATSVVGKCNRVYLRGIESITRTSPLSAQEVQLRSKFTAVSRATSTRLKDPSQMAQDQAAGKRKGQEGDGHDFRIQTVALAVEGPDEDDAIQAGNDIRNVAEGAPDQGAVAFQLKNDAGKDGDNIEGEPDVYCDATATSPVGTYPIRISRGSISDENVDYVDGTLTITKAPITITANSYTRVEGDPNPPFEVTYSGFKNGETDAVLTQMPTVTTTATMDSEVGTYDIEASGAEAQNYTFNYVKGILTITERKVLITIDGITYEGLNSLSAAEVVAFDQSEDSLTILETVSDNGKNYRVTSIGRRAFYKCGGIKSVVLPNSIMTINSSAFEDCSSLTSVSLGDGLTYIGGSAFEDCVMLPSITIPNSVTSIALNAFKNCPGLKSVYSEIDIPFEITSDVFSTISPDAELIVPDGTRTIYQNTSGWDVFSKITEVSSMGIDAILFFTNDIQDVTIYSLSGQLVGRTKQKDIDGVWQQLPKGVYIVNGKKKVK